MNNMQSSNTVYPGYPKEKVFREHEARRYVERYYPSIFRYENQNQNPYPPVQSPYPNQNPFQNPYQNPYQPPPYQGPQYQPDYFGQRPPYWGEQVYSDKIKLDRFIKSDKKE